MDRYALIHTQYVPKSMDRLCCYIYPICPFKYSSLMLLYIPNISLKVWIDYALIYTQYVALSMARLYGYIIYITNICI